MNIKSKCVIVIIMLALSLTFIPINSSATTPRTVRGYVFVNDIIQEPQSVQLIFPEQTLEATLYIDGYYIIDFSEDIGANGIFEVTVSGEIYTAEETITIQNIGYSQP